ncbi:hypothetical protein BDD12DRAFT_912572 [Trichophaea hybrida]|nr:hypothetical protein BDD12DRAFT_912572 [Trichophaea hybrida]
MGVSIFRRESCPRIIIEHLVPNLVPKLTFTFTDIHTDRGLDTACFQAREKIWLFWEPESSDHSNE